MVHGQEQMPCAAVLDEGVRWDDGLARTVAAGQPHARRPLVLAGDEALVERQVQGLAAVDACQHRVQVVGRAKPGVADPEPGVQVGVGQVRAAQGHADAGGGEVRLELLAVAGRGGGEFDHGPHPLLRPLGACQVICVWGVFYK